MANKKNTTIKDIANVLGITPSAVSKALSDHPRISVKTKEAVRETAKKMDYRPNRLAVSLRKGKSNLVGVIVPRAKSNFFSSIVENIEKSLNQEGYNVIITQSNESYKKECSNIDALLQIQVDGIIASISNDTTDLNHYKKIEQNGIPLIMFDRGMKELEVDSVGINDYLSSHLVIEHLTKQSCKRIAHIGGYSHIRIYKNRLKGYKNALKKYNLPILEELILEGDLTKQDGRKKMTQLLKLTKRPDAVYASGDYAALGALQVLLENNIRVPEDIALVGFSNEPFTSLVTPSITTVNQHSEKIGQIAAELFLKKNLKSDLEKAPEYVVLEPELIIRESSKRQ
ncbi:MAG: LacI family DNA-binding transcriptional regulator [Cellulophaga sp.]